MLLKIYTIIILSFPSFLFSQYHRGTCIIVYLSKDTIFVGADNLTSITDRGNSQKLLKKECKIYREDSTFFVIAGNDKAQSINSETFAVKVARKSIREAKDLANAAKLFIYNFHNIARLDTDYVKSFDANPLEVAFFGIHNSIPKFSEALFLSSGDVLYPSYDMNNDQEVTDGNPYYCIVGMQQISLKYLESNKDYFDRIGKINAIKNLIEMEHLSRPDIISSNPDLLSITKNNNITWFNRNDVCSEFK